MNQSNNRSRYTNAVLGAIMTALLAACSGGGDGGSSGGGGTPVTPSILPPATGPGDTQNYAPNGASDAWTYNVSASDGVLTERDLSTLYVNGAATVRGQTVTVYSERMFSEPLSAPTYDLYYQKGPGGVAYYGNNDPTDTLTAAIVPYAELLFPVTVGPIVSFTKNGLDMGDDLDGDGRNETIDATQTTRIAAFESITVPAGTFPSAAKRVSTISGNAKLTASTMVVPVTLTETTWLAPGAGIVRRDTSVTATAAGTSISITGTLEARGYTVAGVRKGMGNPVELLPAAQGPQFPTNVLDPVTIAASAPAVASDGTSFLMVTRLITNEPVYGNTVLQRMGHLRSADNSVPAIDFAIGAATPYTDLNEIQRLAYGGGTYLAVFEQRNFPPSGAGAPYPSILAHRIAPLGAVTDTTPIEILPAGFAPMNGSGQSSRLPAVAYGGGTFLVVYMGSAPMSSMAYTEGRLVSTSGIASAPFRISPEAMYTGLAPRVVFDGTNFIVATGEGTGWRLQRVTPSGTVLDPAGTVVPVPSQIDMTTSGAGGALITWIESDVILNARRFDGALGALDAAPFSVANGFFTPRFGATASFIGGEYVVAWMQRAHPNNFQSIVLYMQRISVNGTVQGLTPPQEPQGQSGPFPMLVSPTPANTGFTGGYVYPAIGVGGDVALLAYLNGTLNAIDSSPARRTPVSGIWMRPFAR